ncbi:hypothetical protein RRG08_043430 [Elysia crispata]|uniref:Uncharacterized protein n=1 Tax=Elysia crispata TaxID=231223 RepID=A0AAE1D0F9_9GAST|nr:hypothetical protein RRG08_043430 [Elysia crispata]
MRTRRLRVRLGSGRTWLWEINPKEAQSSFSSPEREQYACRQSWWTKKKWERTKLKENNGERGARGAGIGDLEELCGRTVECLSCVARDSPAQAANKKIEFAAVRW